MNARLSFPQPLFCALLGAAFFSFGCDDPLKSVSSIEETRVLGARVEVESEPTRSSPNPGENATLRFFVAAPGGEPNVSYALSVCAVSPTNTGFPSCAGAPFAVALQAAPSTAAPELDFQVPAGLDLEATPHAFAQGLICPNSGSSVNASGVPSCDDGLGTEVAFEFDLGGPDQTNQSPTFADDALSLDGAPWLVIDPTDTACPGGLPEVSAKTSHRFGIALRDGDFEPLRQVNPQDPARETLLVSQFSDAGKLSHAFISVNANTPAESRAVNWDAPALTGDAPTLARFYFVVREDFTARALCVVP